jgi:hypothetical protein
MSVKTRVEKLEQHQRGNQNSIVAMIIVDEKNCITGDLARDRWRAEHPHSPEPGMWIEIVPLD